jgi:hypothetical protein
LFIYWGPFKDCDTNYRHAEERRNGNFNSLFVSSAAMQQLFRQLKTVFMSVPVLIYNYLAKPILLETDVLGCMIAGIISQQVREVKDAQEGLSNHIKYVGKNYWHPVATWSRSMSMAEPNYMVGGQEMLAIVMSCRHWQH